MDLSYEVYHRDVQTLVDFYVEVLSFQAPEADHADSNPRRPPDGSEIVLRVEDFHAEYDRVLAYNWPPADPIPDRLWGLRDFRLFDPSGHYLRVTSTTLELIMSSHV